MGTKRLYTADSNCSVPGCTKKVLSYVFKKNGKTYYHPHCHEHRIEYLHNKNRKRGLSLAEKQLEEKAREWNKAHPFHPDVMLALSAGMNDMQRISSGGRVNDQNIA